MPKGDSNHSTKLSSLFATRSSAPPLPPQDDGPAPILAAADRPRTLDGGAAEATPVRAFEFGLKEDGLMKYKNEAILARVEEMVEFLRKCHVRDGWKIDEEGAERALSYFRRHVDGPAFADEDEDTAAYQKALEFFRSHGQSIDWVHDGNPIGMICRCAYHSTRAAELAAAIDGELVEAYQRIVALMRKSTTTAPPSAMTIGTSIRDTSLQKMRGLRRSHC
jgi:hypothetical protein